MVPSKSLNTASGLDNAEVDSFKKGMNYVGLLVKNDTGQRHQAVEPVSFPCTVSTDAAS